MISKRDLQLGKLALRAGMVTKDQITRCLALKKKLFKEKGKKASLGALLIKKGWLTEAQLEELVRQHNEKFGDDAGAASEAATSGEASAELAASGEASAEKKVKKKKKKKRAEGAAEASGETAVATEPAAAPAARGGSSRRAKEAAAPAGEPTNGHGSEEQVAEAKAEAEPKRSARVRAEPEADEGSASDRKKKRDKERDKEKKGASRKEKRPKDDGSEDAGTVESAVESGAAPTSGSEVDPAIFQSAPEGAVDEEDRRLIACPECGKKFRVREQQQGKRFTCRRCKSKVKVPKDLFDRPLEAAKKKGGVEVEEFSLGSSDQTSEPDAASDGEAKPKGSVRTAAAKAAVAIQRVQQQQSIADLAKAAQQATKKGLPPRTRFGPAQAAMVFACFGLVASIVGGGLWLSRREAQREEEARRARAQEELALWTKKVDEVLKLIAPALEKKQPAELSALLSDLQSRIKERETLVRGSNRTEADAWLASKGIVGLQRSLHVARGEGLERLGTPVAAEEAVQAFGAAAELSKDDEALQVQYARRLVRAGRNSEAAQRLERFSSPAALAVRGLAYERGGATPQAVKAYQALKDGAAAALAARAFLGERSLDRVVEVVAKADGLTGADLAAAKMVLGAALDLRDDPNGARKAFDEAVAAAADSPFPRCALGEHLLRRGRAKDAVQAFQAAQGIVGTARGFLGLGDAHAALLDLDRARSAWKDAAAAPLAPEGSKRAPGDVDPFEPSLCADPRALAACRLAALEAAVGRADGARAGYGNAQLADPFSIEAAAGLALLEVEAKNLPIADAYLLSALGRLRRMGGAEKETVRSSSAAVALLVRGAYFIEHGRYQDAADALAGAVQADGRVAAHAASLRGRLLELQSQHTRAYDAYAEAASLEAQPTSSAAYAAAAELFAASPDDAGAQDKVLAGVTAALSQNPWHARAHLLRGRVLVRQKKAAQALPSLDRAIQLNSYLRDAYVQRGWVYARELPEAQQTRETSGKAFVDFEYALRIEQRQGGEKAETHCGLAQIQYMQNALDKAHDSATKAIGIDPEHAEAYRLRALIRTRQGDAKGAAEDQARHQQLTKK